MIFLDFEFYDSNEKHPTLVCCSLYNSESDETLDFWLHHDEVDHRDEVAQDKLAEYLTANKHQTISAFASLAEARCFDALGLNCMDFQWVDLYSEWKLLRNHNDSYKFGTYFSNGVKRRSTPGTYTASGERVCARCNKDSTDCKRIGCKTWDAKVLDNNLVACAARLLEVEIDKDHKVDTIKIILSRASNGEFNGVPYSEEDKAIIQEYCRSDVTYLPDLTLEMSKAISKPLSLTDREYWDSAKLRGRYIAALSKCESEGMPLNMDYVYNLSSNYESIIKEAQDDINELFPVFVATCNMSFKETADKNDKAKVRAWIEGSDLSATWPRTDTGAVKLDKATLGLHNEILREKFPGIWGLVFRSKPTKKTTQLVKLVESLGLTSTWPRTDKGNLCFDSDALKKQSHIPEIRQLQRTNRTIVQMRWFRPEALGAFTDKVGSDGNLRPFFGPFGAQSGRNTPPAKTFPLVMSSWLRAIIRAPKGWVMTAADVSSQEVVIAAYLAKDQNMLDAYRSGDVYLHFAKLAGAVPMDGLRKDYSSERDLFKAVKLGLQFGLGVKNLAISLTDMMGRDVSEDEAQELMDYHKKAFPDHWKWKADILNMYYYHKHPLILGNNISEHYGDNIVGDGWALFNDNPRALSVTNMAIQGLGASMMRESVIRATEAGLKVIAPLHDAVYIVHREEDTEAPGKLAQAMYEAAAVYMKENIRVDLESYPHDKPYIVPKGKADYDRFSKYLKHNRKELEGE